MQKLRCNACGTELESGTIKYVVEIRSFADFDGYLEEYEGNVEEGINYLLESMENEDIKNLEEDVSMERIFILCKRCRDKFMNDPIHGSASFQEGDVKGTVH